MKKFLLGLLPLFSLGLTACGGEATSTVAPSTSSFSSSSTSSSSSVETVDSSAKANEDIVEAITALAGNHTVTIDMGAVRHYDNPIYASEYNSDRAAKIVTQYAVEGDLVRAHAAQYVREDDGKTYTESKTEDGLFEAKTGLVIKESLKYDGTVRHDRAIIDSRNDYDTQADHLYRDFFRDLKASDFTYDASSDAFSFDGTIGSDIAASAASNHAPLLSSTFTLKDGRFDTATFVFEDLRGYYADSSFNGGSWFDESLSIGVKFGYEAGDGSSLKGLSPVTGDGVKAISDALGKLGDKYIVKVVPPTQDLSAASLAILVDGDKVALDYMDIMGDGAMGTLSMLDAKLVKDDEGEWDIENIALDEDTGVYSWVSTRNLVVKVNPDTPNEALTIDPSLFALHLDQIQSGLFTDSGTKSSRGNTVYNLNPSASKYFGQAVVPTFIDYTGAATSVGFYAPFTYLGNTWTAEVLEDGSIYFAVEAKMNTGSAEFSSSTGFLFTPKEDIDVSFIYTEKVPDPVTV